VHESRNPLLKVALTILFIAVTALPLVALGMKTWRLPVASDHGVAVDATINYLMVATGVIMVIGHIVLGLFLWKYGNRDAAPQARATRKMELFWGLAPVFLMSIVAEAGFLAVGFPVLQKLYLEPAQPPLEIEVVGKQFEWIMRYPGKDGKFGAIDHHKVHDVRNPVGLLKKSEGARDDIVHRLDLVVPVGRPIKLHLRTLDVLHSFWVPAFRTKQDLIPGFITTTQFTVTQPGTYEIGCAELCGLGHYKMNNRVRAVPQAEYDAWLAEQTGWFE